MYIHTPHRVHHTVYTTHNAYVHTCIYTHTHTQGADDNLVKVWSSRTGQLLATLRGHCAEVTDMSLSCDNTMIASGSLDKSVRVWCSHSTAPVAVLSGHQGHVTSVQVWGEGGQTGLSLGGRGTRGERGHSGAWCILSWRGQWLTKHGSLEESEVVSLFPSPAPHGVIVSFSEAVSEVQCWGELGVPYALTWEEEGTNNVWRGFPGSSPPCHCYSLSSW